MNTPGTDHGQLGLAGSAGAFDAELAARVHALVAASDRLA